MSHASFSSPRRALFYWAYSAALALLFLVIAFCIVTKTTNQFDQTALLWIHSFRSSGLDALFLFFTSLGNVPSLTLITTLIVGLLIYRKNYENAQFLVCGVVGAAIGNGVLKLIFQRSRPELWHQIITETGYSFPSGHAMINSALIMCLIVLLWQTRYKIVALVLGVIVTVMISLSRLYLGVHYPTDVIAGIAAGCLWAIMMTALFYQNKMAKLPRGKRQ